MLLENQIDWSVFTQKERLDIQKLVETGHSSDIAAVVHLNLPVEAKYLVFAKVAEMEKIKLLSQPANIEVESGVQKEYEEFQAKGGQIKTPDQEKEWQAKFNTEKQALEEKKEHKLETHKRGRPPKKVEDK